MLSRDEQRRRQRIWGRAAKEVRAALASGELVRQSTCEQCGATSRIEPAHFDYDRPLDVRWLCQSCHRRWDAAEPKTHSRPTPAMDWYEQEARGLRDPRVLTFLALVVGVPFWIVGPLASAWGM